MRPTPHNIVVIGGGPAGCVAAFILARAGREVTLVEQHRYPREKVCGECLSALGVDVLRRLGLDAAVRPLGPVPLSRALVHARDGRSLETVLPRPMWGLSRAALDAALLDAAREAGVQIFQPVRAERLTRGRVDARDLLTNERLSLSADLTLLADGKAALVPDRPRPTTEFGLKAHFENVAGPADAIELFAVDGHYGGVAPIEGGRWNVAFAVPAIRLRTSGGNLDGLFAAFQAENAALAARFASARRLFPWLTCPLPRFMPARRWPPGVLPVGNAAAALEPIGGEGMGLALRSAELAATAVIQGWPSHRLRAAYTSLWRTRAAACRAAAVVVSNRRLNGVAVRAAGSCPPIVRLVAGAMGKGN